ncbi:MAG TPA: hypothetical protein VLR69_18450 [Thermoanaerobaculia bacterium]|nr:hypothetical protein [Thermoanaerobaculia bacterium]
MSRMTGTADTDLSAVNGAFREHARKDERLLSRSTFSEIDRANPMLHYALQPWPTFVGPRVMGQMGTVAVRLSQLIRQIPERAFANDPVRIGRHFDLDPDFVAASLAPPNGIAGAVSRADFVLTASGFRCIEFNIASSLGGWESGILADMLLRVPAMQGFLREREVAFTNRSPVRELFRHVIREAVAQDRPEGGILNVGIGLRTAATEQSGRRLNAYLGSEYRAMLKEIAPALQGNLLLCHYPTLTERDGRILLHGTPVHSLLEWHNLGTEASVFRALKAGTLEVYNGPAALILADKRCIAILSEQAENGALDPADRDLVRAHVPWTRRVLDGTTVYRGEEVSVPDLVTSERPRLVLKKGKATSAGGSDVVLGRTSTDAAWGEALRRALTEGDWLVQELVESLPFLYQSGLHGCSPHDAIWGPFVFGSTFAGAGLRVQPKAKEGIVNLHRGATVGIVLEVESD